VNGELRTGDLLTGLPTAVSSWYSQGR
jgi:hypothetical protein